MAEARALRNLVTTCRVDTTQAPGHSDMHGEIVAAILFRRPTIVKRLHIVPQVVADLESLGRGHGLFLRCPALSLRRLDRFPITARERQNVLFTHRRRIARDGSIE